EVEAGHDPETDQDDQDALQVGYDFGAADTWVAIRYPFATVARDLSNMLYLQFWAKGAADVGVFVDLGMVSEDINGDGLYQTEDNNPHDDKLNSGEDLGLDGVDGTGDYGENNGYLDGEDMDGDNALDTLENYFRFANIEMATDTYRSGDWVRYRVPLTAGDTQGDASWEVAKHVRLRLVRKAAASGVLLFDQFEIVGNRWTDA
ncbi:MAG TPA: hypothetical protein PKM88_01890, partial [bacterium]|nr:hypothetical protein [bacterium]